MNEQVFLWGFEGEMSEQRFSTTTIADTSYFRSELVVKKNRQKCRLRRPGVEFLGNSLTEGHFLINDGLPHELAGYDVIS